MFGDTASAFNAEMFASEILFLDDTSVLGTKHSQRAVFSEQLKEICVGSGKGYHSKGVDRVNAAPWWVLIRLMNSATSTLETLPLDEDGVSDKWILLKAAAMAGGGIEMPDGNGWYDSFKKDIANELPCFLDYLLNEHEVEDQHKANRYAVASYKNESLMTQAAESSVETSLLNKINTTASVILLSGTKWQGSSSELHAILAGVGENIEMRTFEKTCPTPSVLASQLKKLEGSSNGQIQNSRRSELSPKRIKGSNYWQINPLTDENPF